MRLFLLGLILSLPMVANAQTFDSSGMIKDNSFISVTNSTSATLSGGGVFTGGSVDALGFSSAYIIINTDVAGTMRTLTM